MRLAYREATALLICVADGARLEIMCQIAHSAKTVEDIADATGLSFAAASEHLTCLRDANLVYFQHHDDEAIYTLAPGIAGNLLGFLEANFPSLVAQNSNEPKPAMRELQKSA